MYALFHVEHMAVLARSHRCRIALDRLGSCRKRLFDCYVATIVRGALTDSSCTWGVMFHVEQADSSKPASTYSPLKLEFVVLEADCNMVRMFAQSPRATCGLSIFVTGYHLHLVHSILTFHVKRCYTCGSSAFYRNPSSRVGTISYALCSYRRWLAGIGNRLRPPRDRFQC